MSATSIIPVQSPHPFTRSEDRSQTASTVPLTKIEFWNAIHLQFKHLTTVFLQICKNEQCIALNGKLVIECKTQTFVNGKGALLAAHDGLEIRSKKIENRGVIFSKGMATAPTSHDRSSAVVKATTDLILRTSHIDNRRGVIESTDGAIHWISGRHAVLNNDNGTFVGKNGIIHQAAFKPQVDPTQPVKLPTQLLSNHKGKFISEGLIDLSIPYIDNTEGLFQGHIEKMHTGTFLNKHGQLRIAGNAELTIDTYFDNESGLVEAAGALHFHKGIWRNHQGVISAPCGLNADVKEFVNTKEGLVFASCGEVKIFTESDQTQKGKIEAALGILLLTAEGVFWGENGRLLTPQHVEITAVQGKIELGEALVHARTLGLSALAQVDMSRMHVKVRKGLTAVSQTQWIDAHQIDLSEAFGLLKFNVERYFNLENSIGSIGGTLSVHSQGVDLSNNALVCEGDLDFQVQRFKSKNTTLTLPATHLTIDANYSIYTETSHVKAPQGAITESSKGWISKHKDSAVAASIQRQANQLSLIKSSDEALKIKLIAAKSLSLQGYEAEAHFLEIHSGGTALIQKTLLNADEVALKVDTLWLTEATLNFERAKIKVVNSASLRSTKTSGKELKVKVKQGTLDVQKSRNRTKRSTLKAKNGITLTESSMQGALKLESEAQQLIANNLFGSGDFKVFTSHGDVSFRHNQMFAMGDISFKAPQGSLTVDEVEVEAENISGHSKTASLHSGRMRVLNKVDLQAQSTALSDLHVEADTVDVAGKDLLHLDATALKSKQMTSLSSEHVAYIQKSFIGSQENVSLVAETALIDQSSLLGETGDVHLAFAKRGFVNATEVQAENTFVKSEHALFNKSVLQSEDKLALKGSFGFTHSKLESRHATHIEGENLRARDSHFKVSDGDLSTSMKTETLLDSHFAARNITQTSGKITSIHSSAEAREHLSRTADILFMLEGADAAQKITLQGREHSLLGHTLHAVNKIDLSSSSLDMSRSSIFGPLTVRSRQDLLADHTQISGDYAHIHVSGVLNAPHLQINSLGNVSLQVGGSAFLPHSSIRAAQLGGSYAHIHVSGDLGAPHLQVNSLGDLSLKAGGSAFLPNSILHAAQHAILSADDIHRNHSILSASSLAEQTRHGLVARNSHTTVLGSAYQDGGSGALDLTHSSTHVGSSLVRKGQHIHHTEAKSSAWEHIYEASRLDNLGGRITLGGGNSRLTVDQLYNDHRSYMSGPGRLQMDINGSHIERGNYRVGALEQTARNLTLAGDIQTDQLKLRATHGNVTLNSSLNTIWGSFTAQNKIVNNANLGIQEHGEFKSRQMDNNGSIQSDGSLSIDQAQFKEMGNVSAQKELLFFSDSSINTYKSYASPGTLGFISRGGYVHTHAPVHVGGDFMAEGSGIRLDDTLHAGGQGIFKSPGMLHFNRMNVSLGNGLFADVKTLRNDAGYVEVHGSSHIRCEEFLNMCSIEPPKAQTHRKLFGFQEANTASPYAHTPATYWFHNDLVLEASKSAINDASNLYADSLSLRGHTLENRNRTHVHSYREAIGSYRNSFAGFSYGKKKTLYKDVHEEIIDGVGNIQVAKIFDLQLSGAFKNDGVVNADSIIGRMSSLDVGNFNNQAQTPSTYSQHLKSLVGDAAFRPGGEIRSQSGTSLQVEGELRNRGYIESKGAVAIRAHKLFNKRFTTEQSEQVVVRKTFGRRGTKTVQSDLLNHAEASIHGSETQIFLGGDGKNIGGSITAVEHTTLIGKNFSNEAISLRTATRLKTGQVALWQKADGYSMRTDFHPGLIGSGNKLDVLMEGNFHNSGSNVVGWGDTSVVAGSIEQKTLFSAPYKVVEKRKWNKSVDSHAIAMQEGQMVSVTGNTHVESTVGSAQIEGAVGSYAGSAAIISAADISFQARTLSAENKTSSISGTPTSITSQTTHYNTTQTSLPSFFAGGGDGALVAKGSIQGEGVQLSVEKDLSVKAQKIHFKPHEVVKWSRTSGMTAGVSFFGSQAIEAIAANKSPQAVGESVLREDLAISSVFDLARSKGGLSYAVNGLKTAVATFSETAKFAKVYNQDNLAATVGEHLGITDLDGNFNPRVTVRVGSFEQESIFTQNIPSRPSVGGHATFEASTQEYHGWEISRKGKGATFIGDKISFRAAADSYTSAGSSMGMSLTVGPRGPYAGVDYAQQSAHGISFQNGVQDFGEHLTIHTKELNLQGVALVADNTHVVAKQVKVDSLIDTQSHKQVGISGSTSGDIGFNYADGKSERVSTVAGIRAHHLGTLTTDELNLNGALIENMAVDAQKIVSKDIHTHSASHAFSASLNLKEISAYAKADSKKSEGNKNKDKKDDTTPSSGFAMFGAFDFKSEAQKGITRSTITGERVGAEGKHFSAINRDPAKVQETRRQKRIHLGAPIVVPDFTRLQAEVAEIKHAFNGSSRPSHIVQPPNFPEADLAHSSLMAIGAGESIEKARATQKQKQPAKTMAAEESKKPIEVQQPSEVFEEPSLANNQPQPSERAPGIEPSTERVEVSSKKLSVWDALQKAHEAEVAGETLKEMAEARVLAKAFELAAYPIEKAIELTAEGAKAVCKSHPTLEKGCRAVVSETKEAYQETKKFIVDHIPDAWKEKAAHLREVHREALLETAIFNEVHYQIPRERTFQYQNDCHSNTLSIATFALFNSAGSALRATTAKTLAKPKAHAPLVGEIVKPGTKEARRAAMAKAVNPPEQLSFTPSVKNQGAPSVKPKLNAVEKPKRLQAPAPSAVVPPPIPEWALLASAAQASKNKVSAVIKAEAAIKPVDPRAIMSAGKFELRISPSKLKEILPQEVARTLPSLQKHAIRAGSEQKGVIDGAIAAWALNQHKSSSFPPVAQVSSGMTRAVSAPAAVRQRPSQMPRDVEQRSFSRADQPQAYRPSDMAVYNHKVEAEQALVKVLSQLIIPIKRSQPFPSIQGFLAKCEAHKISRSKIGELQKGYIRGQLLYLPVEDGVIFLIKNEVNRSANNPNILKSKLIEAVYLKSHERVSQMIAAAAEFAQAQGYERIFMMWEPATNAVASQLVDDFKLICGMKNVSSPASSKQYVVAELNLSNPAAEGAARLLKKKLESMFSSSAEAPMPPKKRTLLSETSHLGGRVVEKLPLVESQGFAKITEIKPLEKKRTVSHPVEEIVPLESKKITQLTELKPTEGKMSAFSKALLGSIVMKASHFYQFSRGLLSRNKLKDHTLMPNDLAIQAVKKIERLPSPVVSNPLKVDPLKLMYGKRFPFVERAQTHLPVVVDDFNMPRYKQLKASQKVEMLALPYYPDPLKLLHQAADLYESQKKLQLMVLPGEKSSSPGPAISKIAKKSQALAESSLPGGMNFMQFLSIPRFQFFREILHKHVLNKNKVTSVETVPNLEKIAPKAVIEDVVKRATAVPEQATSVPKSMDVLNILKDASIPAYGSEGLPEIAATKEFVHSILGEHQVFVAEELASPNSTSMLYYALDAQAEFSGIVKAFTSMQSPHRGFIPEIVSLEVLRNANLKHSTLQKIQAIGKIQSSDADVAGLILYDYISGYRLDELFKINPMQLPTNQVGKAIGEINAIHQSKPVDQIYLQNKTNAFRSEAQSILERVERLGLEAPFTMDDIEGVIKGVNKNPGQAGLTLGDISVENVMINNSKVVLVDTGTLMESVNVLGEAHGLPALDKYLMAVSMRKVAIQNGYSNHMTKQLLNNFMTGYASQCAPFTPESELFAELFWELTTISGAKQNSLLLETTLASVSAKFKPSEAVMQSEKIGDTQLKKHTFSVYQLTGKHLATKNDIFKDPIKTDVKWGDIESLITHLGAEIIEGNGSRMKFVLNGEIGSFHRPHCKDTDKGALKSVRIFLEKVGVTKG